MDIKELPARMTTFDLSVLFDTNPDKILELTKKGKIRGLKKGNRWIYRRKDVLSYMEKHGLLS